MHDDRLAFNRSAGRPLQCLREGWQLIKDDYWLFLGIGFVGMLIAGFVPLYIMLGPMMCGIHICLLRHQQGRRVSFEMLFDGFHYFTQSLIATMLFAVPMVIVLIGWYIAFLVAVIGTMAAFAPQGQGPPGDPGMLLVTVLGIEAVFFLFLIGFVTVVSVLVFFIYPLIVDRELSGTQAVLLSMKAAWANLGGVLGIVLLEMLLSLIGTLFCFVGSIFVIPVSLAMVAVAYRHVFPVDEHHLDMLRPEPEPWDEDDVDADDETGIRTEPKPRRNDSHVREG